MESTLRGAITALITPLKNDTSLDEIALEELLETQLSAGIQGLALCGSTGEGHLLREAERGRIYDIAVQNLKNKTKIIASCCEISTSKTLESAKHAIKCGVDYLMIASPPYIKPCQEGLYTHFKTIHDSTSTPIIIYNHPGRTGISIRRDTICKLAELPRIVALKEADTDLSRVRYLKTRVGKKLALLSGDDSTAAGFMALGGQGCISVASNAVPDVMCSLMDAWIYRNMNTFYDIQKALQPLFEILTIGGNPSTIKCIMNLLGYCENTLKPPLQPISKNIENKIKDLILNIDILNKDEDHLIEKSIEYGLHE